ncbi:hypothetical protein BDZ89DRAFT_1073009 [Hymenopellis radicata]|nr:hypothetical protein BDZ89DRAFT_1073009 [Hymenopellis radicata]
MDSSVTFILYLFVVYYLVERCIQYTLKHASPAFHQWLFDTHKLRVFTGICMGALITLLSTPSCARASFSAVVEGGLDEESTTRCLIGRSVLWVAELNRLDLYNLYVVHHLASLLALGATLTRHWPLTPFLVIVTTLISEIPGDILWIMSAWRDFSQARRSEFHRRLILFNAVQYTVLRCYGIVHAALFLFTDPDFNGRSFADQAAGWSMMGAHVLFCGMYVRRQILSLLGHDHDSRDTEKTNQRPRIITVQSHYHPFHIVLAGARSWIITIYGPLMGLGFASLALAVVTLTPVSTSHAYTLPIVLGSAIVGARLFSLVFEDGLTALRCAPLRTILRPGFWLHGGVCGVGVAVLVLNHIGMLSDVWSFLGALGVGFPFYEVFSRIGCHHYGCCYGCPRADIPWAPEFLNVTYAHPTYSALARSRPRWVKVPLFPVQLLSALAFALQALLVPLPLLAYTEVSVAFVGSMTLAGHAIVRLVSERYRADYRGMERSKISLTAWLAMMQFILGVGCAWWTFRFQRSPGMQLDVESVGMGPVWTALVLGTVVYGVNKGEIGRWA